MWGVGALQHLRPSEGALQEMLREREMGPYSGGDMAFGYPTHLSDSTEFNGRALVYYLKPSAHPGRCGASSQQPSASGRGRAGLEKRVGWGWRQVVRLRSEPRERGHQG